MSHRFRRYGALWVNEVRTPAAHQVESPLESVPETSIMCTARSVEILTRTRRSPSRLFRPNVRSPGC